MKIVVDTNRIIAALIKDGASRRILVEKGVKFISPDIIFDEIYKYEWEILEKANINHAEFEILLSLLINRITILSKEEYFNFLKESETLIEHKGDVPFLAAAISQKADGIWSDDGHFNRQTKIKIFSTKEMLEFLK